MDGAARLQVLGVACGVWHTAAVARPWKDRRDLGHWAVRGSIASSGAFRHGSWTLSCKLGVRSPAFICIALRTHSCIFICSGSAPACGVLLLHSLLGGFRARPQSLTLLHQKISCGLLKYSEKTSSIERIFPKVYISPQPGNSFKFNAHEQLTSAKRKIKSLLCFQKKSPLQFAVPSSGNVTHFCSSASRFWVELAGTTAWRPRHQSRMNRALSRRTSSICHSTVVLQ